MLMGLSDTRGDEISVKEVKMLYNASLQHLHISHVDDVLNLLREESQIAETTIIEKQANYLNTFKTA